MKTDTELEDLLRATLASHAQDVREAAPVPPVTDLRRPARRWLPLLAAAAVIAVVVATVLGIRATRHSTPTHPSPTPVPTSTRSGSPAPTQPAPNGMSACQTSLPAQWATAVQHDASRYGADSAMPLAISADGRQLLVARDFGTSRDVAVVGTSGAPRPIFSVPQPDQNQVQHASIEGDYAVIDLQRLPRNANGVLGTDLEVVLVDLRNLHSTLLDSVQESDIRNGRRTIDGSVISGRHVYWDVKTRYANRTGTLRDYDVVTGQVRDVFSGTVGPPSLTALGISLAWDAKGQIVIPRDVPAAVQDAMTTTAGRNSLITDGSAYAWLAGRQVAWWAPGQNTVTEISFPRGVQPSLVAVAGRFVVYTDTADENFDPNKVDQLLDAGTGAHAVLTGLQPYAVSGAGVVVPYRFAGNFKESPTAAVRLDTTGLPGLHC